MAKYELKLPKMGESVAEASITNWLKDVGDFVEADDVVLEIATDKVDTDVPCEVEGVLRERLFEEGDVVKVGQVIAIIDTDTDFVDVDPEEQEVKQEIEDSVVEIEQQIEQVISSNQIETSVGSTSGRFYSPLVKNIANQEGLTQEELDSIKGTGAGERVTKNDILDYLRAKKTSIKPTVKKDKASSHVNKEINKIEVSNSKPTEDLEVVDLGDGDEVIEMTRMGKIISQHMTKSLATSAHVQSFIEVDVTNIVNWRKKVKDDFFAREGEKLTFTPIFMEIVAQVLKEYPLLNVTVNGDKIIKKKNINLGMAAALPNGDLIVPVIKNADQLNLVGMAKVVNDLANRSRKNALKPDEINDGTYTVTNIGSFGTVMGTPIINQPQVGILALGAIRKIPAVIETPQGDFIGVRSKMYLSHSYDHRVVNGALGGQFIQRLKEYIEAWDINKQP